MTRWCMLVPVRVRNSPGFMWKWRTLDRKSASRYCYAYFYDCVRSAHRAGLRVDMNRTCECARQPEIVPFSEYRSIDRNRKRKRRRAKLPAAPREKGALARRRFAQAVAE